MKNALPQKLYVREVEEREPEDNWLNASVDFSDLSEPDSEVIVGIYKLEETVKVENKTILKC